MESNPLVSVLMTAFNRAEFIAEAIESVLASSYKNLELIICDDHSTDQTVAIAKRFQKIDSRVIIYINDSNLGDYYNRNKVASFARGKYLKYLDSDDTISPDGLAKMVSAMEAFPVAALGIVQFNIDVSQQYPVCITPTQAYLEHYDGMGILRYGPTGTIIKKDVFRELNGFSTERFLGDTEFWLKLAAKYPILKIEPGVVWWRIHEGQEYDVGHKQHAYLRQSYPIFIRSLQSPECPLQKGDIDRIVKRLRWKHARDILRLGVQHGKLMLALIIFKEVDFGLIQLLKGLVPYNRVKDKF